MASAGPVGSDALLSTDTDFQHHLAFDQASEALAAKVGALASAFHCETLLGSEARPQAISAAPLLLSASPEAGALATASPLALGAGASCGQTPALRASGGLAQPSSVEASQPLASQQQPSTELSPQLLLPSEPLPLPVQLPFPAAAASTTVTPADDTLAEHAETSRFQRTIGDVDADADASINFMPSAATGLLGDVISAGKGFGENLRLDQWRLAEQQEVLQRVAGGEVGAHMHAATPPAATPKQVEPPHQLKGCAGTATCGEELFFLCASAERLGPPLGAAGGSSRGARAQSAARGSAARGSPDGWREEDFAQMSAFSLIEPDKLSPDVR